jgi:O-acetyl-ADP-ribose deacetylase (regulator of RNase III)
MSACKPVEMTFGNFKIGVVLGDITDQDTEAIVNAANNHLWMGSGVAGAIRRKGGAEIEQEAQQLGPIEPGAAITTSAGRLKAKYCIHAAVMGQDLTTSAELITRATRSALIEAERRQIKSIAFPALGTGVGGFPVSACARLMLTGVVNHCRQSEFPRLIRFVLFDENAYQAFVQTLATLAQHQ